MKIVCPHCNTNYQIDDARVPEKGLPVKCSACGNKFRVFREKEENEDNPEPPKEDIVENGNSSSDVDSLFDSMPSNNNQSASDLDALLGGDFNKDHAEDVFGGEEEHADDGGIEMASYHDEMSGAPQQSDAGGVTFGGGSNSGLDLANDRLMMTKTSFPMR